MRLASTLEVERRQRLTSAVPNIDARLLNEWMGGDSYLGQCHMSLTFKTLKLPFATSAWANRSVLSHLLGHNSASLGVMAAKFLMSDGACC